MVQEILTFEVDKSNKELILDILGKKEVDNGKLIDKETNELFRYEDGTLVKLENLDIVASGSQIPIRKNDIDSIINYVDKHIVK